jgi:co-chaperonin GroES (HSP10)
MKHSEIRAQIKPFCGFVVVDPIYDGETSMIALPDARKYDETGFGIVVAKGEGAIYQNKSMKFRVPIECDIGDLIVYRKYQHVSLVEQNGELTWTHAEDKESDDRHIYHLVDSDNIFAVGVADPE